MKIKLSEIKARSPRVRQSQSTEELDVLAASIGALNAAIIPVGVRKNGEGYDLVYGHRRVAAAKQAGLKEIEAIEVVAPDDFLKVYGLVENVVREDMTAMDIARTLKQIKDESGWTDGKVAKFFGRTESWARGHTDLLEPEVVKAIGKIAPGSDFGSRHLREVKAGLGTEHQNQMPAVVHKVVDEGLSTRQARHVAEEVAKARVFGGDKAVKRMLATPYEDMRDTTLEMPEKPRRPVIVAPAPKGKVLFSWIKDRNVVLLDTKIQTIGFNIDGMEPILNYMRVNKKTEPRALAAISKQAAKYLRTQASRLEKLAEKFDTLAEEARNV